MIGVCSAKPRMSEMRPSETTACTSCWKRTAHQDEGGGERPRPGRRRGRGCSAPRRRAGARSGRTRPPARAAKIATTAKPPRSAPPQDAPDGLARPREIQAQQKLDRQQDAGDGEPDEQPAAVAPAGGRARRRVPAARPARRPARARTGRPRVFSRRLAIFCSVGVGAVIRVALFQFDRPPHSV